MKQAWHDALRRAGRPLSRLLLAALAAFIFNGCSTEWLAAPGIGPGYEPENVYRSDKRLAPGIKRVAVLPLTASDSTEALEAGMEALEPVLQSELGKSRRFELVPVSGEQLRQWTGRSSWRSDEALPAELFEQLRAGTACDGVLFSQLTVYRAYTPVAVGWKFRLVECTRERKGKILWAVDEVVDSGEPDVVRSAREYYSQHVRNETVLSDPAMVLYSPRQFSRFSLDALLATLPTR
jgi:hypothetical protein